VYKPFRNVVFIFFSEASSSKSSSGWNWYFILDITAAWCIEVGVVYDFLVEFSSEDIALCP